MKQSKHPPLTTTTATRIVDIISALHHAKE
jgi:hypothetical protein